jgi:hypothetical protein
VSVFFWWFGSPAEAPYEHVLGPMRGSVFAYGATPGNPAAGAAGLTLTVATGGVVRATAGGRLVDMTSDFETAPNSTEMDDLDLTAKGLNV